MRTITCILIGLGLPLASSFWVGAQVAEITPDMFHGFIVFHSALAKEIQARHIQDPDSYSALENAAIANYSISKDEFAALTSEIQKASLRLAKFDQEILKRKNSASGLLPPNELKLLHDIRIGILVDSMDNVKKQLSKKSWKQLHTYINTITSKHVKQIGEPK